MPDAEAPVKTKKVFCFLLSFDFRVKMINTMPKIENANPNTAATGKNTLFIEFEAIKEIIIKIKVAIKVENPAFIGFMMLLIFV